MRKLIIASALLASSSAIAQQAQEQPALATYRELLAEANGRIVALSAQLANVSKQNEDVRKQIEETKKRLEETEKRLDELKATKPEEEKK